jgi:Flp pilus assembly protein TadD
MAFVVMGIKRSYRGDNTKALEAFREGVRLEPNDATVLSYLGYGLARTGKAEEARAAFLRASALGDGSIRKKVETALPTVYGR